MQPCNLAWKLNWYRQSELEGALLLGRLVRQADDPELIARLTKHCADEARHAPGPVPGGTPAGTGRMPTGRPAATPPPPRC